MNTSFDEIVAFLIDIKPLTFVTGRDALLYAKFSGGVSEICIPIRRKHMEFMAACDLGPKWTDLANAPTLFYLSGDKEIDDKRTWEQFEKLGFKRISNV